MSTLTERGLNRFLTRTALMMKLAVRAPSGDPHVVPVWYEFDGSDFFVMGSATTAWVRYLKRSPRVAACVDTHAAPYTQVLIKGTAEVVEEEHYWSDPARSIRYFGEEAGRAYFEEQKDRPRVLVRIHPRKLTTWSADPGEWNDAC